MFAPFFFLLSVPEINLNGLGNIPSLIPTYSLGKSYENTMLKQRAYCNVLQVNLCFSQGTISTMRGE